MSNKIYLDFKSTDDGGLIVRINYNDPDLAGKSAVLSVERTVTVKDRRPVHGKKRFSMNLILEPDGHRAKISPENLKSIGAAFPYSGHMIKIETFVRLKVNDSIIPFMDTEVKRGPVRVLGWQKSQAGQSQQQRKGTDRPQGFLQVFQEPACSSDPKSTCDTRFFDHRRNFNRGELLRWIARPNVTRPHGLALRPLRQRRRFQLPLVKALTGCGAVGVMIWLGMRKQLRKYMTFRFKAKLRKVNRESFVNAGELIAGSSRVDLFDATFTVVACNLEKGQYVRGSGSNKRTVSFKHPTRAVLLYSKRIPMITKGTPHRQLLQPGV